MTWAVTSPVVTLDLWGEHNRGYGARPLDGRSRPAPKGSIDTLPSGSLRVRVYAGTDVLTGKPHYVGEVIKPGPHAAEQAEEAKQRLVDEVQADRHTKTNATLVQLIEEHLKTAEVEETTKDGYRANLRKHIGPQFKSGPAAEITAHTIEKFKAELHRCRDHCDGRPRIEHRKSRRQRKTGKHTCTARCRRHVCKPLAKSTVRKILFLISGAYQTAQLWGWLHYNPVETQQAPFPIVKPQRHQRMERPRPPPHRRPRPNRPQPGPSSTPSPTATPAPDPQKCRRRDPAAGRPTPAVAVKARAAGAAGDNAVIAAAEQLGLEVVQHRGDRGQRQVTRQRPEVSSQGGDHRSL
jgi:hypothetical protein